MTAAAHLERFARGALFGLAGHAVAGNLLLACHLHVPVWLLPAALLIGVMAADTRPLPTTPHATRWLVAGCLVLLAAATASVVWGSLATPSRSFDGAAVWDLKALVLTANPTLEQPFFRDPAVFCHSRDYPLTQPLWMAAGAHLCGSGRVLFPALFMGTLLWCWLSLRAARCTATIAWLATTALAMTPFVLNPNNGAADSGYAELFTLAAVTAVAAAMLSRAPGQLVAAVSLLVTTKPEGLFYGAVPIVVAFVLGERQLLRAAASGWWLGAVIMVPLQHDLASFGAAPLRWWLVAAVTVAAMLLPALDLQLPARRGARLCVALLLPVAMLLGGLALGGWSNSMAVYFGEPSRALQQLLHLPQILWALLTTLAFSHLGLLAWYAAFANVGLPANASVDRPALLGFVLGGLALVPLPFLLSPEADLGHHLRSSLERILSHWLGAAALLGSVGLRDRASVAAAAPRLLRLLVPAGSRRDRALWMAWLAIRKLREGPLPWLRAVRLGLFQLLPPGLQKRWSRVPGRQRGASAIVATRATPGVEVEGLVSVVLPVYQQAGLLGDAIASVLAQDHRELELIVVDDGSGPEVATTIARFAADPRLRHLRQPNRGLPRALDAGFEVARGEFWTWTSADNVLLPGMLTALMAALRSRPAIGMVYADYELIDDRGQPLRGTDFRVACRRGPDDPIVRLPRDPDLLAAVQDNFVGPCFLYRGLAGRLLGPYHPEMGLEDYDHWLRMHRSFGIGHLGDERVLYRYRLHGDSLTAKARELRLWERGKALLDEERRRAAWPTDGAGTHVELVRLANAREAHEQGHALGAEHVVATAADAATAARAAIYTRRVLPLAADTATAALVQQFAIDCGWRMAHWRFEPPPHGEPHPAPVRPLRVLLQTDDFVQGGLERVVLDLGTCLRARGVEVTLAICGRRGAAAAEAAAVGVRVIDGAGRERELRERACDVVLAHDSVHGAADAAAAAIPFVQVLHNSYVWFPPDRRRAYADADRHTAAYVAVSAQALAYADLQLGLDVGKAVVIHNGIAPAGSATPTGPDRDTTRAQLGVIADEFLFVQVAALHPPKAQRAAIAALARLRSSGVRAQLLLVGREMDQFYARAARADAERLGVAAQVHFAGHRDDVAALLAAADAFVLPSLLEGCSLAVWEAVQAGLPLVLTDVGAARSQMQHARGVLVAPPYGSLLDVDWTAWPRLLAEVDDAFVQRLADAMCEVAAMPRTPRPADAWPFARERMAADHHRLCAWLTQNGHPAAIRGWFRQA